MPYNTGLARSDAQALVAEDLAKEIIQSTVTESAALRLFRRVPMASNQQRMPVLAALPTAYWVTGDTGLKQTTQMQWSNKYLNVEEIAVIVPVPDAVLADTFFDIWGEVRPRLAESVGRAIDAAIFLGTNKPASWPNDISTDAAAAGNVITRGTATQANGGLAKDISDVMGTVEADGFDVNGFVMNRTYKAFVRAARDTTGQRLLDFAGYTAQNEFAIDGSPAMFALPGLWASGSAATDLVAGDFTQGMIGVRQDMTWRVLTEAVLQDNTGAIIYNLAQQDMVALRLVMRLAWQVANPITYQNTNNSTRYPFGIMRTP